jgi:hypothetical protein
MDAIGGTAIDVTTIDQAVEDLHIDRVDLIKMDIESGEVDAPRGTDATLLSLAPKLAVFVCHKPHDLPDTAALIGHAQPDCSLYLSHRSPNWNETVLYACVSTANGPHSR